MKVALKIAVCGKSHLLGNAHHGCRIYSQAASHRARAEQHEFLRVFQHRPNHLSPLAAQPLHINLKIDWGFSIFSPWASHGYRSIAEQRSLRQDYTVVSCGPSKNSQQTLRERYFALTVLLGG